MGNEIRRKKLADYIIDEIKRMLEQNELKEGDKLPDQVTFSKQLGVSRSSLREALQRLESMGVVKQNPKRGTVIINGNPGRLIVDLKAPLYTDYGASITEELLEARRVIETSCAQVMINSITDSEIANLEKLVEKMENAHSFNDTTALGIYDLDFHIFLAKCTKNRYLVNMYLNLYNQLGKFIEEAFEYNPVIKGQSIMWHNKILNELKKDDKSNVPKLIEEHLRSTENDFRSFNISKPENG